MFKLLQCFGVPCCHRLLDTKGLINTSDTKGVGCVAKEKCGRESGADFLVMSSHSEDGDCSVFQKLRIYNLAKPQNLK